MKNQRGSVTVLAIITMTFIGIIIAGLLPMITNEVKLGTINKDMIEAQYAAESGVKRAIVEFNLASSQNWDWVDTTSKTNWKNYIDTSTANLGKKYHVTITLNGNTVVPASSAVAGTYTITSTAIVGNVTKIAKAVATVSSGSSLNSLDPNSPAYYTVFAGGDIAINGNYALNGAPIAARGDSKKKDSRISEYQTNISPLPSYTTLTASLDSTRPVVNLNSSTSKISTSYSNKTLIYDGDVTIKANSNFTNVTIYATGSITIESGGINFNNTYIVAGKDMSVKNKTNFSNTVVAVSGSFKAVGGVDLNSGSIMVGGDVTINGASNLNYSKSAVDNYFTGGSTSGTATITSWSGT